MARIKDNTVTTNRWYWRYLVTIERITDASLWHPGRKIEARKDLKEYTRLMAGIDFDTTRRQAAQISKGMKAIEKKWGTTDAK